MSEILVTTNADSGDGSLREAILSASAGDVIKLDPEVFDQDATIVLSSALTASGFTPGVTIEGEPGRRIILSGQGASTCAVFNLETDSGETTTFRFVTFERFYRNNNAPAYINALGASDSVVFDSCIFRANVGGAAAGFLSTSSTAAGSVVFNDCLGFGNACSSSSGAGFMRLTTGSTTTATFNRCTLDNVNATNANEFAQRTSAVTQTDSLIAGVTAQFSVADAGFVSAASHDYRLAVGSGYLLGATSVASGAVDVRGRPRRSGGALGAFEGSVLYAANETFWVEGDMIVDDLELVGDATLAFEADSTVILRATQTALVEGTAEVSAAFRSYLVVPKDAEINDSAIFNSVVLVRHGANASDFAATTRGATWTSSDPAVPVLIEVKTNSEWTTLASVAGQSWSGALALGTELRLYDGNLDGTFLAATVQQVILPLGFHPWGCYDASITVDTSSVFTVVTGYLMMSSYYNQGETPLLFARVTDSETNTIVDPDVVDSISYTCYKRSFAWSSETRTPVPGHENVAIPLSAFSGALVASDSRWTVDSTGYNFIYEPDSRVNPIFPSPGEYVVIVTIRFTNANPLPIVYNITAS